ncbi:putative chitinase 10 [Amphibalanus amphitrite]|uniref:Putative chitinase 10 n=1 Tax=Amphibalanus amphitrite TaxID=1232801 RepID=A0A6A4W7I6_AMPAM|nr:putative chitinase 10 [Amphibalanus amphitrite]
MNYYLGRGVPGSQLMMGFPLYGRGFKLQDPSKHAPYDPSNGPMDGCPYSEEPGFCGYNELCERIFGQSGWTDVHDGDMQAIYSYKGSNWIGWDDLNIVKLKLDYLKSIGVGGAMLWSIDTDDFRGLCGPKYAIANLIWSELNGAADSEGRE